MLLAFCDAGFLLTIFAVSTCIQTTAANNAARTSESKCAFGSGQIDFDRLLARHKRPTQPHSFGLQSLSNKVGAGLLRKH